AGVPLQRVLLADLHLAEQRRTPAVGLLRARRPVVPGTELAEALHAELERGTPAVAHLRLVAQLGALGNVGVDVLLDQDVQVAREAGAEIGLEQRAPAVLPALAAILRALDLQQEADVDRVLAGLGELEAVLPFPGVEAMGLARLLVPLGVQFRGPP